LSTRWEIVRRLARKRLAAQGAPNFALRDLDNAPEFILAGIPENTLLTCAESLVALTAQGLTEEQAFERIEEHRSSFVPGGELPRPLTLANYARYRMALEGSMPLLPLTEEYLEEAAQEVISLARAAYRG